MTSETTARALTATDLRAGIWRVVPQASSATFSVHDKILLTVHGMLPIRSGIAVLEPDAGLHEARVELDAAGIDTGNERRDRDLAKPGLLNYTTYPTVVVTTGPATLGPHGWDLAATIRARGADCPVSLHAVPVERTLEDVRVHVHGRFDRTGMRMRVPRFVIGRFIDVDVDLHLTTGA